MTFPQNLSLLVGESIIAREANIVFAASAGPDRVSSDDEYSKVECWMKIVCISIGAIAVLMSNTCFAEMYKWTDAAGTMHITDYPPRDPKYTSTVVSNSYRINISPNISRSAVDASAAAEPDAGRDAITVTIPDVEMAYFDIEGSTAADLTQQLEVNGLTADFGQKAAAATTWSYAWSFPPGPSDVCAAALATVTANIKATFPRWTPAPDTSPALVERWNRYLSEVKEHELGHVNITKQGIRSVQEAFGTGDCRNADLRGQEAVERIRKQHNQYDCDTFSRQKHNDVL